MREAVTLKTLLTKDNRFSLQFIGENSVSSPQQPHHPHLAAVGPPSFLSTQPIPRYVLCPSPTLPCVTTTRMSFGCCGCGFFVYPPHRHLRHSPLAVHPRCNELRPLSQVRKLWRKDGECYSSSFVCFESPRHGHQTSLFRQET